MRRALLLSSTPAALAPADRQIPSGSAAGSVQVQGPRRSEEMGTGAQGWRAEGPADSGAGAHGLGPQAAPGCSPHSPLGLPSLSALRRLLTRCAGNRGGPGPDGPCSRPISRKSRRERWGARGLGPRRGRRSFGAAESCAPRPRAELLRCGPAQRGAGSEGRQTDRPGPTGRAAGAQARHEGTGAAAPERSPGRSARGGRTAPPGKDIAAGARPPR